jgi:uncharacterized protein (TIGR02145 family)
MKKVIINLSAVFIIAILLTSCEENSNELTQTEQETDEQEMQKEIQKQLAKIKKQRKDFEEERDSDPEPIQQINNEQKLLENYFKKFKNNSINKKQPLKVLNFKKVKIGSQTWMTKNLNLENFRNGDPIPRAKTEAEWLYAAENGYPAWCYYNNVGTYGGNYGKLYNLHAIQDSRGLAPEGWRIPSVNEWKTLITTIGDNAGKKMRDPTIKNGFSAVAAGRRHNDGRFILMKYHSHWWSSDFYENECYIYSLGFEKNTIKNQISTNYGDGYSVRCIKD